MARAMPSNPFRPGAGHMPLYLAGREVESNEFKKLLTQQVILENMILTGLRGVGKTVLLDTLKPLAINDGWLWVGADLTEATSLSDERVVVRMLTDLAVVTSSIEISKQDVKRIGFHPPGEKVAKTLTLETMLGIYQATAGLTLDKIKAVLEVAWQCIQKHTNAKGLIFAYDEAQNMSDRSERNLSIRCR